MTAFAFFIFGYAAALFSMAIVFIALCIRAPIVEDDHDQ